MKIEKLEDIQSWQEAQYLTKMIYGHTKNSPLRRIWDFEDKFRQHVFLLWQILRKALIGNLRRNS